MAHPKVEKTNAARLLDRAKIAYELVPYRVDEEHLAATHVAEQLGEDIAVLPLAATARAISSASCPATHEVDLKDPRAKISVVPPQEGRSDSDEGAAARDGLHPQGLFADRHEKGLSDLHPRHGRRPAFHLCQCGGAGSATQGRPFGPGGLRVGRRSPRSAAKGVGLINTGFFVVFLNGVIASASRRQKRRLIPTRCRSRETQGAALKKRERRGGLFTNPRIVARASVSRPK